MLFAPTDYAFMNGTYNSTAEVRAGPA